MAKNIIIYSDGTGQAGGFRFDETRSNVYKLYRATRCGPDSPIDPNEQIAFYDPGLGSQADGANVFGKAFRWVHNTVAQATGFGITRNLIDCYAALIQLWRPGDRIFLIGFSRGSYTVRCLAGIIARCGIPTHPENQPGGSLKIDDASAHSLAAYAVKHVYQFTYPRKKSEATPRQSFLLDTREKVASRFRIKYGSNDRADPTNATANPYFIGVFDTVAALGNPATTTLFSVAFLLIAAALGVAGQTLTHFVDVPVIGRTLGFLSFRHVFFGSIVGAGIAAVIVYFYTHLKWDFRVEGYGWRESLKTLHLNDLWMQFYDTELHPKVDYARHAISIDENRENFKRVGWSSPRGTGKDEHGIQWFEQVWFAGNHSDIGGSYPENQSRLSDITLDWMLRWAVAVPNGLKFDRQVLRTWPAPDGPQHDEVAAGFGSIPRWTGITWAEKYRDLPKGDNSVTHSSVYRRFDLEAVPGYYRMGPYRPPTLERHVDFKRYWLPGASFPADSLASATEVAGEPPALSKAV
jgi:hypothetical protein